MRKSLRSGLNKTAKLLEKRASLAQGKGWGSSTIDSEVTALWGFLETPPRICIDIGGNVGNFTASLRLRNADCLIHVFEPSRVNVETLKQRFSDDTKIYVVPFALSDFDGNSKLYFDNPGSPLASLTKRKLDHFAIDFNQVEEIKTVRFENYWITELQRQTLDIVKLDIEGHELDALRGFGECLKSVRVIQFEFGGANIDSRTFFQDFFYFFEGNSFDLYRLGPLGPCLLDEYKESDEFFVTTNFIAVNRSKLY